MEPVDIKQHNESEGELTHLYSYNQEISYEILSFWIDSGQNPVFSVQLLQPGPHKVI